MIDRAKNICYVIFVPYVEHANTFDYKYQKFLSLHQIHTKAFEAFRDKYFMEVLNISPRNIGKWDKMDREMGSQQTIRWFDWVHSEKLRQQVLEGITEREKCW